MVREQIVRVRMVLTLHLTVLAFLTAMLAATGSGHILLPMLVLLVGVSSFLFVDWFEWWSLHHTVAYVLMIVGTITALHDYPWGKSVEGDAGDQLYAIASLLIYPELVLMMQRKNMRLFEQMAIFLLLEIIVAALVNDNVLFGILLAPIVVLWVSSLLLLTRYAALIRMEPSMDRPTPRVYELVLDYFKQFQKRKLSRETDILNVVTGQRQQVRPMGWTILMGQAAPIGIAGLVFAGMYFYLLPRTKNESLPPLHASLAQTGFTPEVSLGIASKLMQNKATVMKVAFFHSKNGKPYQLQEPPYIRMAVVSQYVETADGANFQTIQAVDLRHRESLQNRETPSAKALKRDDVTVKFDLEPITKGVLPTMAPMYVSERTKDYIQMYPFEYTLAAGQAENRVKTHRTSFELSTAAFTEGIDNGVLPSSDVLYGKPQRKHTVSGLNQLLAIGNNNSLKQQTKEWVEQIMERAAVSERFRAQNPVEFARAISDYFANSGEYTYSLDVNTVRELDDPISDFVLIRKHGHCQYFASALTFALRHNQIPARIVIGFHPLEYNELGKYFHVRNSDAHAWVEAYFSKRQLAIAGYTGPEFESGGWVRLDPTPSGNGSNAGSEIVSQENQATDYIQGLWKDYFLDSQQLADRRSLYTPVEQTAATYKAMIADLKTALAKMKDQQLAGGAITSDGWFSWRIAILTIFACGFLLFLYRTLRALPKWAPGLARRLGLLHPVDDIRQPFFRTCLVLLRRAGFRREANQTPEEHTLRAGRKLLDQHQWTAVPEHLRLLTESYYAQRFGGKTQFTEQETAEIQAALDQLQYKLK